MFILLWRSRKRERETERERLNDKGYGDRVRTIREQKRIR